MTESYSETHNFTLHSARDDGSSSHIMVLLAQDLVNTERWCSFSHTLIWTRKKHLQRPTGLYSSHVGLWSVTNLQNRNPPFWKF